MSSVNPKELVRPLAGLFSTLDEVSKGEAEVSARLLVALIEHESGSPTELAVWAHEKPGGTVSKCLSRLWNLGLVDRQTLKEEDRKKLPKQDKGQKKSRVIYVALAELPTTLQQYVDRRLKEDASKINELAGEIVYRLKSQNPVIMMNTLVSSPRPGEKLKPSDYEDAVNLTINLYRKARKNISILTRDFTWIEDPLPIIQSRLRQEPELEVELLVAWDILKDNAQRDLRKTRSAFKTRFRIRNLQSPEAFRLSLVDDENAIVVKKSIDSKEVLIEGAMAFYDREFTSIVLRQFFESRWKIASDVK